MRRLTRDGTVEPVSRDQILRRERGQGNIYFLCSADHVQDWQPYPVDPDVDRGVGGVAKIVPVLGGDGTKIAPPGDIFDQPPGGMS